MKLNYKVLSILTLKIFLKLLMCTKVKERKDYILTISFKVNYILKN